MPNFYARQVLEKHKFCFGPIADWFLVPILKNLGVCKTIADYGYRLDNDGNPLISDCNTHVFTEYYYTQESFSAFRSLYYNYEGMQDKFVDFWGKVSDRFANNTNVIGFDPLNEPVAAWRSVFDFLN